MCIMCILYVCIMHNICICISIMCTICVCIRRTLCFNFMETRSYMLVMHTEIVPRALVIRVSETTFSHPLLQPAGTLGAVLVHGI